MKLRFKNSDIRDPLQVYYSDLNNIHISNNVFIDVKSTIRIIDTCRLYIGEGTYIGPYSHLSGTEKKIVIGKNVLLAPRVYITTTNYKYEDIDTPIIKQGYVSKGDVVLGDGCWIGIGSCILSGTQIGKNSVIGSNSVVTNNIPPFSVAVGSPARIVNQYNEEKKEWQKP
jgi:acetyltransferase-like isoleucine patch superfamily enzyme